MSGNGTQNYANNRDGWNWWPSNQNQWNPQLPEQRPATQILSEQWWNGPWNQQDRGRWDQWWNQQQNNRRQPIQDQWNNRQDQWNNRRQPIQDQWNDQQYRRRPTQDQQYRRRPVQDQYEGDWDRFYLTGRRLRDITILVDPRGRIFILADRQLLEVQTDPTGRIRIHRDRRGRVWILTRRVQTKVRPQLRTQSSLADLARANGLEETDY